MKKSGTQGHINNGASACGAGKTAEEILRVALEYGILTTDTVSNIDNLIKKNEVLKVHKSEISQGKGKDKRWFTYLPDETKPNKRRKIFKTREKDLYDALYDFYFGQKEEDHITLKKIYSEWKAYRAATCNRINTVYRNDLDWKKYYLDEPLSEELINKPVEKITLADLKKWVLQLIRKYQMTQSQYTNMKTVIKQLFQYLIDNEVLDRDPTSLLKLPPGTLKKNGKKPAETQIFYQDEVEEIIAMCYRLAEETEDETYYAIPLFFLTGERIGEILGLGHDDFNEKDSTVYVHRSLCTQMAMKGDGTWTRRTYKIEEYLKQNAEPRTILVTERVFEIEQKIRKLQIRKGRVSNYLFHVNTQHAVTGKLYRICRDLGIVRRSPHKCRKTYISNLLNSGIDPDFVREQAGHKDLQTTMKAYVYSTTRNAKKLEQLKGVMPI